jgi:hypothetical protein
MSSGEHFYLATITEELDGEIDISDTRRQIEAEHQV